MGFFVDSLVTRKRPGNADALQHSLKKEAQLEMTGLRIYGNEYMMYSIDSKLQLPCIQIDYRI
jgi:hypothetical protein